MSPQAPYRREWSALLAEPRGRHPVDVGLSVLLPVAAASSLARFRPFISMFLLCFEAPGVELPPPIFLGVAMDPPEYLVWWGPRWSQARATILHLAPDPREAVILAEQLLANWPYTERCRTPA